MNWGFTIGGVIAILTCIAHLGAGEYVLSKMPLDRFIVLPKEDPTITKQTFRFVWHTLTVDFLVWGIVLLILGTTDWIEASHVIGRLIATCFVGYALVIAVLPMWSLRRVDTLLRAPQWMLGVAIASLAWGGTLL